MNRDILNICKINFLNYLKLTKKGVKKEFKIVKRNGDKLQHIKHFPLIINIKSVMLQ